jgi:hypothetical protein
MKGEIDSEFYCSANAFIPENEVHEQCNLFALLNVKGYCGKNDCNCYRRKYLTPEQYLKEYGEEYPDDGAVYYRSKNDMIDTKYIEGVGRVPIFGYTNWYCHSYSKAKAYREIYSKKMQDTFEIVCACTPFGKPDNDWRPQ